MRNAPQPPAPCGSPPRRPPVATPALPPQEEAAALGKSSFAFAFYMDRQKEERERGVTISCTTKEFFTEKFHYTIIDAPGARLLWGEREQAAAAGVGSCAAIGCSSVPLATQLLLQLVQCRCAPVPRHVTCPPACARVCQPLPIPASPQAIAISSRT